MSRYGDMAVAGIGVAMKVTMITGMICIGYSFISYYIKEENAFLKLEVRMVIFSTII